MTIRYFEPYLYVDEDVAECRKKPPALYHFSYDDEALKLNRTETVAGVSESHSVSINCEQLEELRSFADNDGELCLHMYCSIEYDIMTESVMTVLLPALLKNSKFAEAMKAQETVDKMTYSFRPGGLVKNVEPYQIGGSKGASTEAVSHMPPLLTTRVTVTPDNLRQWLASRKC